MEILFRLVAGHDPLEKSFLVLVAMAVIMLAISHICAGQSEHGNQDGSIDIRDRTRQRPLKRKPTS